MRKLRRRSPVTSDPAADALRPLCVTVDEAADLLSIGRTRLYQLIAAGDIDMLKIGKSTRIRTESLDLFLARAAARDSSS